MTKTASHSSSLNLKCNQFAEPLMKCAERLVAIHQHILLSFRQRLFGNMVGNGISLAIVFKLLS